VNSTCFFIVIHLQVVSKLKEKYMCLVNRIKRKKEKRWQSRKVYTYWDAEYVESH